MTNEQLAIFLRQFHGRLSALLDKLDDDLGTAVERYQESRRKAEYDGYFLAHPALNPEMYERVVGTAVCLNSFHNLLRELDDQIRTLAPKERNMSDQIDISGIDKAALLAALYNASQPLGMGFLQHDPAPMSTAEAQTLLDKYHRFDMVYFCHTNNYD